MEARAASFLGVIISLVAASPAAHATPEIEGRVRLTSGAPVVGAQVRLFDLDDLRAAPLAVTTDASGRFRLSLVGSRSTGRLALPDRFDLGLNYPNPFNPSTFIPYQLPVSTHVRLDVFNVLGQRVATPVDGVQPAGYHTARWDATDEAGRAVAAGVYLYRLQGGGVTLTERMVLVDGQAGLPASRGDRQGGASREGSTVYGLTVSGPGMVAFVDPAFPVAPAAGSVDVVVQASRDVLRAKAASTGTGVLGDVDNNGWVNIADALLVLLYSADPTTVMPNDGDISQGDVNADGRVDLSDAWLIASYSVDPSDPLLPPGIGAPPGVSAPTKIYWSDLGAEKIRRSNLDGSQVENLVTVGSPLALALGDLAGGKIYWTEDVLGKIQAFDLDRSQVEDLVTGLDEPYGLALDLAGGKIYWSDSGTDKIQRANLDGSGVEDLVTTGLIIPGAVALDKAGGKVYWADEGTDKIQRANLDGSQVEDLVTGLNAPAGLALNLARGQIYWIEYSIGEIRRANLDGSRVENLVTGLDQPAGLVLDVAGRKMYWTDFGTDKIQRANLDGSRVEDLITTGHQVPFGIALGGSFDKMYWADWTSNKIQRANRDGSGVEDLVATGLVNPYGVTVDKAGGKVYWSDFGTDKIQRANLDGSQVEDLVTAGLTTPGAVALDVVRGQMYWTDRGTDRIQRANLDGSGVEDLITTGLSSPNGLVLDLAQGRMYWTDYGTDRIQRANLDGSNVENLVTTGLTSPAGLALDLAGGKMYWSDFGTDKIQRANLDGSNVENLVDVEDLVAPDPTTPRGLAVDAVERWLYWADPSADGIWRATLDGSFVESLVTGLEGPVWVALDTPAALADHGNSRSSAAPVTPGSETAGELEPDDVDYFRVEVAESGALVVAFTTGGLDTRGYIEDSSGNVLASNDDGGEGSNFRVTAEVDAGTYYIRVTGYSSSTAGPYTLHVEVREPDDHGNRRSSATPVASGSETAGELEPDDVDYFRVEVAESGVLVVALTTGGLDTHGTIEDSAGTFLASNDDGGEGSNFRVTVTVDAGTYYIRVRGFDDESGPYTLHVEVRELEEGDWSATGTGARLLDLPNDIEYVRITGEFQGNSQNFTVWCGSDTDDDRGGLLVNELMGTSWDQTRFSGIFSTRRRYNNAGDPCGQLEINYSVGVQWTITEVASPRGKVVSISAATGSEFEDRQAVQRALIRSQTAAARR